MWLEIHVRADPRRPAKTFNFGLMFQRAPYGAISTTSITIIVYNHPASPVSKSPVNCGSRSIRSLVIWFTALCAYDCSFSFRIGNSWLSTTLDT